jgi:polyisoprenoid-binding protein YceI
MKLFAGAGRLRSGRPMVGRTLIILAVFTLVAACSGRAARPDPTQTPALGSVTQAATSPATASVPTAAAAQETPSAQAAEATSTSEPEAAAERLRLVLVPEMSEARYRVREQLASLSFPSDAVGVTQSVSGAIVVEVDGSVAAGESGFVVDLRTLRSDSGMRDNFIQANTLETGQYPTVEFRPTAAIGLPSPLPTAGVVSFQLVGDLSLHGVTREATWDVTAEVAGNTLIGSAATAFTFDDYNLRIPRVARVLSVDNAIALELDFHFELDAPRRQSGGGHQAQPIAGIA